MEEQKVTTDDSDTINPFSNLLLSVTQLLTDQVSIALIENSGRIATEEEFNRLFENFNRLVPLYCIVLLQDFIKTNSR